MLVDTCGRIVAGERIPLSSGRRAFATRRPARRGRVAARKKIGALMILHRARRKGAAGGRLIAGAVACLAGWLSATGAQAQFMVTNNSDSGAGSLRQAIINADNAGTTNGAPNGTTPTISFAANVGTITLASALPLIDSSVTINGAGATLDGAGQFRGLFVSGLATTGNGTPPVIAVSISNLTIQNVVAQGGNGGAADGGGGLGAGGGLFVNQNASVT